MKQVIEKKRVLFICTHNSSRSQMAEGLLNDLYGNYCEAYSAGTAPSNVNPYAIKVMKEIGIDISNYRSKSIKEFRNMKFDYVVTVCDHAKETCPFFLGANNYIHSGFRDPSEFKGKEDDIIAEFRHVRGEIKEWIEKTFGDFDERVKYEGYEGVAT
ncbi:MAG: Glutaredoxin arsenate reductase [candidate division WS2 bacterium]|uniref:Glutaredoxin arsenate reductase n=1 Tax=Psychracetigena formicireducens TaxID=2986056 RepID=A0A9E2F6C9_PSYF1|nr:Glutaredoxin arsenate reductase [Candidatus Psychracetigena formicireducens]MBT9144463.1 Glutaredoxin arsenate reductase [Candidatus Psychracetigena formicireducens]